jgi:pimeloyl-ACP methyl ester carboxylesterase
MISRPVIPVILLIFSLLLALSFSSDGAAEHHGEAVPYGNNPEAGQIAQINGIPMYFETYGSGEPMLVIHGNGDSIHGVRFQIAHFAKQYRVIAADSRGHGKSGLGTDPLNYDQMMEDWNSLADHLGVSSANIIGWSDGGILALLLAINHPDKVNKMAIMGANLRSDETAVHSWAGEMLQPMSDATDEMIASNDTTDNWLLTRQLLDLLMTQPNIAVEDLHGIEAPVLVMAGDKDVIRNTHTLEMFDNLRHAHLAIMPGQTHFAPVTDPDGFNALVDSFFGTPFTRPDTREIMAQEFSSQE